MAHIENFSQAIPGVVDVEFLTESRWGLELLAKVTVPLMKRMVSKAIESDMDAVKAYCEGQI